MRYALIARDKPDHLQTRLDNRPAHLDYMKASGAVDMAGPFLDDAGNMCGSLIVLNFDTLDQAWDWANNEPYFKAGLFAEIDIKPWNKVIG